ncbi:fibronectin type III domain-containing protein [Nakamurella deserti]|uniref:fibronectin type III domain-containing protein n=1 Tax=Nakamurella deserti TaxID=2164074 RepID=UPI0013006242|nr:fibronectin type III domain-containing protein [Nakamurella deserti]
MGVAQAAVPTYPDNVVVFPDRDFVTIEGYQDHIGETATVTVTRGSQVIGSAVGTVAEGDVAFEINHPGGVCWGAGTGLNVTPDIQKGDKVSITFSDGASGDTITSTGSAAAHAALSGNTVTVTGTYGPDVIAGQAEVRIVNPDLTALVGKRDVRAVTGGLAPAPKGGYSSNLEMADGRFTATFDFDTLKAAQTAAATQVERFMSWQVEDADANRQGLTISEFGEFGGPGMGGCPAGPADSAPPKASYTVTRSADKTKLAVKWTPADTPAGTPAITNYNVAALKADGTFVGSRVGASATGATLAVDPAVADYTVEVRSVAGAKMGDPFEPAPTAGTGELPADQTAPNLTINPAASGNTAETAVEATSVTLGSESAADVYFTTDGSEAVLGDLPGDTAQLYRSPIAITALTEIHAVAIDRAGNISKQAIGFYKPAGAQVLNAPTGLAATAGIGQVALKWVAPSGSSTPVTGYQVEASTVAADGTITPLATQPVVTTDTNQIVTGLASDTKYSFTVKALYGASSSAPSGAATATTPVASAKVTISSGRWKNADTRIQGTTDQPALTSSVVRFYRKSADGTFSTQYAGPTALVAAVAPATGSTFDGRFRTTALTGTTNPGQIVAKLFDGSGKELGVSAPFALTG